jgi:hypothetical protein
VFPASLQTPAAVVLVVGGLLACLAGYRLFRIVLGIYGFILGVLLATSIVGTERMVWTIVAAIGGGFAGALLLILAYFVGVALIGAGVGAMAVNVLWTRVEGDPHAAIVIGAAIVGALAALALQRYVIIIATAYGGAQTVVVGAAAIMGSRMAADAVARTIYNVYPLDPLPATSTDAIAALVLGTVGLIVQLFVTADGRKKK